MPQHDKIHGLSVFSQEEADKLGFVSITTNINSYSEKPILAGVCQHRDPNRACLIHQRGADYQLAILQQDVSNLSDPLVGGFKD